jgi:hypothetical protein
MERRTGMTTRRGLRARTTTVLLAGALATAGAALLPGAASAHVQSDTTTAGSAVATTTVPNVLGLPQPTADGRIVAAGLVARNIFSSSPGGCAAPGAVLAQTPSAGVTVPLGSTVTVIISSCPSGGPVLPR